MSADQNDLLSALADIVGEERLLRSIEERQAYSADLHAAGATCAAAIRPKDREHLAAAVAAITRAGYAVIPRGAGLTYTGGYTPPHERCVVVDLSDLNRIVSLSPENLYITVETGCTWQQIHTALREHGLRLPCFGTFSGRRATVGGGLSGGAVFFGTARYGTVADALLGVEAVLTDGSIIRTGQAAFRYVRHPVYRGYGPDLTGLFVHDSGSLAIKTLATFRVMRAPAATGFASFAFSDVFAAASTLSELARDQLVEDAYIFDPATTKRSLAATDIRSGFRTAIRAVRAAPGVLSKVRIVAEMATARRRLKTTSFHSLHIACAARTARALDDELRACRRIAVAAGGVEIADTIPRAVRADLFPQLNGVLDPDGARWTALNAKVAHTEAAALIRKSEVLLERFEEEMRVHGVTVSRLMMAVSSLSFSYEPVLHWHDEWLPLHRRMPEASYLRGLSDTGADAEARALVERIRNEFLLLFADVGAASNQIGRTYPYIRSLEPRTRRVLQRIKDILDPNSQVNPGALGLYAVSRIRSDNAAD